MLYYKNVTGSVFAYETEEDKEAYSSEELELMSDEEIEQHCRMAVFNPTSPVTPRQIRQALTVIGLRDQVEALISVGPQDLKDWWEFSDSFEIDHPTVIGVAQALNVGQSTLIQLFQLATSL